jgi:hypothetical protein
MCKERLSSGKETGKPYRLINIKIKLNYNWHGKESGCFSMSSLSTVKLWQDNAAK